MDCSSQIVAAALFSQNLIVDLTRGEIIALEHRGAGKTLVVTKVQICLRTVVGDKDLPVLKWTHRPRINVDIGI